MLFAVYFVPNCFWFALSYSVSVGVHVCFALLRTVAHVLFFLCLNFFFVCYIFIAFLKKSFSLFFTHQSVAKL